MLALIDLRLRCRLSVRRCLAAAAAAAAMLSTVSRGSDVNVSISCIILAVSQPTHHQHQFIWIKPNTNAKALTGITVTYMAEQ